MALPLFVYGTLKRDSARRKHPLLREARLVGRASMAGRLYDLGKYSGLVRKAKNGERVRGELYEISDAKAPQIFRKLDAYEGSEYDRQSAFVTLRDGNRRKAWVYVLRKPPLRPEREVLPASHRKRRVAA